MRAHWPLFLAAALLTNSCGSKVDPATLNGTALFVTCWFNADYKVRSLQFIGVTATGNDAFQRSARPDPKSTTDLAGPLTARILLKDALGGEEIELSVFALDVNGEYVEYGRSKVKVVKGRETDVRVDLAPFVVEPDAGAPDAGDAGWQFDAGIIRDGGVRCACDAGCCVLDPAGGGCPPISTNTTPLPNGLLPLNITAQLCGVSGEVCGFKDICEPLRSNACLGGKCSCGSLGYQCPEGNRCAPVNGVFTCVCDVFSNCRGCCPKVGDGMCRNLLMVSPLSCGAAGLGCEGCVSSPNVTAACTSAAFGPGACNTSTNCPTCIGINQCCSANACVNAGFPTCRARTKGLPSACEACDVLRADRCDPASGQCACGVHPPCSIYEYCSQGYCRSPF